MDSRGSPWIRFNDVLVAQVLSLGMEQRKTMIFTLLLKLLRAMGEEVKASTNGTM